HRRATLSIAAVSEATTDRLRSSFRHCIRCQSVASVVLSEVVCSTSKLHRIRSLRHWRRSGFGDTTIAVAVTSLSAATTRNRWTYDPEAIATSIRPGTNTDTAAGRHRHFNSSMAVASADVARD